MMMPILLPHLPALPVLVRQVAQEEVQIFLALWKLVLEEIEQVLHLGLGLGVGHLFREELQVFLCMLQVSLGV